jgi:glucose-1-phosphate cytidylyltransferase
MKVVILAGGFGTRISEESVNRPKPMVEIGGMPILWHIMKEYAYYGFTEFVICAGYKQQYIKQWFSNYYLYNSDVTFDFKNNNDMEIHSSVSEPWKVTIVDTGLSTMTGGRVKRIQKYVGNEPFMLTYGDGVSNVNIRELLEFHKKNGKLATLTAVKPESRFGFMDIEENVVTAFREKSKSDSGWINVGFMVLEPEFFNYIAGDDIVLEQEPLTELVKKREVCVYKHEGFWQCMDTLREMQQLEKMWTTGQAPWKIWK